MILSRLLLNSRDRAVVRDLADVYQLHRTVMSGFAPALPAGERVLFRVDEDAAERPLLLVQSQTLPDWSRLPAGFLCPPDPFDPLPNPAVKTVELSFSPGQRFRFRLRANPTVKKDRPGRAQGHRVAIVREEAQLEWLAGKAEAGGFRVAPAAVRVAQPGRDFGQTRTDAAGQRHKLELHVVQFDGLLLVTDAERFAATLRAGVGSAKGFGCGLLSLAPA